MPKLAEVFGAFLKLGLISFGGPVAHLSYLRAEFVAKRRWLDDDAYGDLEGPSGSDLENRQLVATRSANMKRGGLCQVVCACRSP
jgi:hypothetical protein